MRATSKQKLRSNDAFNSYDREFSAKPVMRSIIICVTGFSILGMEISVSLLVTFIQKKCVYFVLKSKMVCADILFFSKAPN